MILARAQAQEPLRGVPSLFDTRILALGRKGVNPLGERHGRRHGLGLAVAATRLCVRSTRAGMAPATEGSARAGQMGLGGAPQNRHSPRQSRMSNAHVHRSPAPGTIRSSCTHLPTLPSAPLAESHNGLYLESGRLLDSSAIAPPLHPSSASNRPSQPHACSHCRANPAIPALEVLSPLAAVIGSISRSAFLPGFATRLEDQQSENARHDANYQAPFPELTIQERHGCPNILPCHI
jgi:hypothetical protein